MGGPLAAVRRRSRPRKPSAAPTPRSDGYIASPLADWLCFILSPVLAVVFVELAGGFAFAYEPARLFGAERSRIELFGAVWTSGHLFAVVFRTHANPTVFRRHPLRFTLAPAALFVALGLSDFALITGFFLTAVWDVYHSSRQNFGLCRIYDARAGNDPELGRTLDLWINHCIYIGPILAGASLLPTLADLEGFRVVGWDAPARALGWIAERQLAIRYSVLIAGGIYAVGYAVGIARLRERGYRLPLQKAALLVSVATSSIVAWGFLPPPEAFFVANLFHGLQYFGIVWWSERENLGRRLGLPGSGARRIATFAVFASAIAAAGIFHESVQPDDLRWLLPAPVVIALMHFWYDGFVWSVQRGQV
jgi:hypothetical protein